MSRLQRSLERILADTRHGSSLLVGAVAGEFTRTDELSEAEYVELASGLLARRPLFALLHHLLHHLGVATYSQRSHELSEAAQLWLATWRAARDQIGLPPPQKLPLDVVTWSHSGTVSRWLVRLAQRQALTVRCAQSFPGGEGELLAEELSQAGLDAAVVADKEALALARKPSWAVVGADAIQGGCFWNKLGTRLLLLSARAKGGQALVVAESVKCCHPAWRLDFWPEHPARELFETVDNQLVTAFVTELGRLQPGETGRIGQAAPCFEPLVRLPPCRPFC